jgi:hypothetical protein
MKTTLRAIVFVGYALLVAAAQAAGTLRVTLSPSAAVSAGAQWRVDGGAWQNSGASKNLPAGTHNVEFKNISGWIAPASTGVAITNGRTTSLTATYVQSASVRLDLSPTTGEWRIDGGAWRASGTTATGLTPDDHVVDYATLSGYISPGSETITLAAGQSQVVSRSYTQLASLSVTLTPASAQWRVDNGAWQAGGATVINLAPGAHTIDYASLSGYAAPGSESVSLSAGQSASLNRTYTQLAQITLTLSPTGAQWRVDGGAWQASGATVGNLAVGAHTIDYADCGGYITPASETVALASGESLSLSRTYTALASLTVTLSPGSAQWRLDGGVWQNSGATLHDLALGAHTIDYSIVGGYSAPPAESITLASGPNAINRAYVALASVQINLSPASGQWRLDGGAWQASGAIVNDVALSVHTVDYAPLSGYAAPGSESITPSSGQAVVLDRSYTALASLTVMLSPTTAQWRLDGGAWQNSGTTIANLSLGDHSIDYAAVTGYTAPSNETVSLSAGQSLFLPRSYVSLTRINVALVPSTAQWRLDGGEWQASGASASGIAPGSHTLEFSNEPGYLSPPTQTLALGVGESTNYSFLFVPQGGSALHVNLTPSQARWRVDGGEWNISGATVANLTSGAHEVEFSDVPGYTNFTNPTTVVLEANGTTRLDWTYDRTFTGIWMTLNPSSGSYRVDGWGPNNSGSSAWVDSGKPYLYTYEPLAGYYPPHSEFITVNAPQTNVPFTRVYSTQAPTTATVSVGLDLQRGQWRIYPSGSTPGSSWQTGSATITGLAADSYIIEYSAVTNYGSPPAETVTLAAGQDLTLSRTYRALSGQVTVNINAPGAQWAIAPAGSSDYTWFASGATAVNLPPGNYTIAYGWAQDYLTPFSDTITLASAEPYVMNKIYEHVYDVKVSLYPEAGQWSIDGGSWLPSNQGIWNVSPGTHTIDYSVLDGYAPLASETITFSTGNPITLYRSYPAYASLTVSFYPSNVGQWRIDGGPWQSSDATVQNLTYGVPHNVEYADAAGYTAPAAETVTLSSGQHETLYRSYSQTP